MDSLTLSLLIMVFFSVMAIYFLTANYVPAPTPKHVATPVPDILRHNVAVARLMRIEGKGRP